MSVSPERRFATSPKHEMLKKVFKKPLLTVLTSPRNTKISLVEYKKRQVEFQQGQRVDNMEDHMQEMTSEINKTRERIDSISNKLDFIIQHLCKDTMFQMDDI